MSTTINGFMIFTKYGSKDFEPLVWTFQEGKAKYLPVTITINLK